MRNKNFRAGNLNWPYTIGIGAVNVVALGAFFPRYFTWTGVLLCVFFFWFSIWIGIGLCYHRLLTHGSFQTSRWFRYVLTIAGALSLEGGPLVWVGRHRVHHRHADTEHDPHSPIHGLDWAHMLWVFYRVTDEERREVFEVTKDLQRDGGIVLINHFFWLPQVILTLVLYALGSMYSRDIALSLVIWGVGVRTFVGHHITWMVNSIGHRYGYRNFDTPDLSTNNMAVGYLSGGEGWHNNHHKHPASAEHGGRRWFELDITHHTIVLLSKLGLARNIVPFKSE